MQPHAQWCGKACLDSFSVSVTCCVCVSALFDVLWVLCVVEKHGKNHRLQITHRLQFSEVCYDAIREHLLVWCHVSHCIHFEVVFERVLFVPEKHPLRCLVCPWSRPWRLRPQTPSMRNVPTTTEKGFSFPGINFHSCYLTPSHILQPRPDWLLVVVGY